MDENRQRLEKGSKHSGQQGDRRRNGGNDRRSKIPFNLPLPHDSRTFATRDRLDQASNLGLLFNKFIWAWGDNWALDKEKKVFFEKVSQIRFPDQCLTSYRERQRNFLADFRRFGYITREVFLTTGERLILGLGSTSVLETSFIFHPLYGFPYLPASGAKGLARAYAEILDKEGATPKIIRDVFGSEDKNPIESPPEKNRQGKVFFLDGLPTTFPVLEVDIMNPHYSDYYAQNRDSQHNLTPPADWLSPVPIYFLTIKAGTTFEFGLISEEMALADRAEKWLRGGLMDLGAGGKTSAGYGYFEPPIGEDLPKPGAKSKAPSKVESLIARLKAIKPQDAGQIGTIIQELEKLPNDLDRTKLAAAIRDHLGPQFKKYKKRTLIESFLKADDTKKGN
ncbi:MAG: type III-B CRISPR module RAMP protein Cmr6 [Deltaproteobacteria bacterium]|nr:type III-B CRISPR module RAMP protein Cmr6 [Deltaproteobacteria bacterium]